MYMLQASYTSEAWAALVQRPSDREQVFRTAVEQVGGRLHSFYFSLGDYDVVATYEAPDAAKATGVAMAVLAAGHLRDAKTTPLTTAAEAIEAMRVASGVSYAPPVPEYPVERGVYEGAQGDTTEQFGTLEEAMAAMQAAARHITRQGKQGGG
jgi:uncharacterized protein with GYD domain